MIAAALVVVIAVAQLAIGGFERRLLTLIFKVRFGVRARSFLRHVFCGIRTRERRIRVWVGYFVVTGGHKWVYKLHSFIAVVVVAAALRKEEVEELHLGRARKGC